MKSLLKNEMSETFKMQIAYAILQTIFDVGIKKIILLVKLIKKSPNQVRFGFELSIKFRRANYCQWTKNRKRQKVDDLILGSCHGASEREKFLVLNGHERDT